MHSFFYTGVWGAIGLLADKKKEYDHRSNSCFSLDQCTVEKRPVMSVYRDPDLPDPAHQTLKVYQSLSTQKSILTTQVVAGEFKCAHTGCCMFRWWFILFLCPDINKEKRVR